MMGAAINLAMQCLKLASDVTCGALSISSQQKTREANAEKFSKKEEAENSQNKIASAVKQHQINCSSASPDRVSYTYGSPKK